MKKIGITTRRDIKNKNILIEVIHFLIEEGKEVLLSKHARNSLEGEFGELNSIDYKKSLDLMLVFGGDGSVLRAVRNIENLNKTPILPINMGTLGFLAEIQPKECIKSLSKIFKGKFKTDYRDLMDVEIFRNKKNIFKSKILNDLVISYKDIARLISINARIDGKKLTEYRADGLIISSPTGSTAYNLSAGGPILYPLIKAFILTPICPHSFTQKPILIPSEKTISLKITQNNDEKVSATFDGQVVQTLEIGDEVKIKNYKTKLQFIRLPGENFYKTIRNKLHWGKRNV